MIFPNPFRFILAVFRSVWCGLRGYRVLTSEQEEAFRWTQCKGCKHQIADWDYDGPGITGQCELCTCYLAAKLSLTMEACPDRRWGRIWKRKPSLTTLIKNRTTK